MTRYRRTSRAAAAGVLALLSVLLGIPAPCTAATQPADTPVIAVGLGTRLVLYRYDPRTSSFQVYWEFMSTGRLFYENADTHWQMAFGDVDGDGQDELVSVDQWSLNVWGERGTTPVRAVLSAQPTTHVSLAVADPDGDGRNEILVGWRNQLSLWRYERGRLTSLDAIPVGPTRLEMVWNINVGDLDGDGRQDILLGGTLLAGHQDVLRIIHWDGERLTEGDMIPVKGAADVTRLYDWDRDGRPEPFARLRTNQVGFPGLLIRDLDGNGTSELLLNGTKIYRAVQASDGSTVYGLMDQIGDVAERPGEVQPNAAVAASFVPTGSSDHEPAILVRDLRVEGGGSGQVLEAGEDALLDFEAENVGGEAEEVLFRLVIEVSTAEGFRVVRSFSDFSIDVRR